MTTEPTWSELTQLRSLICSGADAGVFLHGQLSADLLSLRPGQLSLAGWHNPQGRVHCLLWVGPLDNGDWRLVTEASQVEPFAAGISRYILRSNVRLVLEPEARVIVAENGCGLELAQNSGWPIPGDSQQSIYAGPQQSHVALGPVANPQTATETLVAAGVPWLDSSLSERFLGQSLNLDILGGISFTKGCFPGQEVLARLHNLGRVKRRLIRFAFVGKPPQAGEPIVNGAGEPRGQVVCCGYQQELLASVELREHSQPLFTAGAEQPITPLPVPYGIPEINGNAN